FLRLDGPVLTATERFATEDMRVGEIPVGRGDRSSSAVVAGEALLSPLCTAVGLRKKRRSTTTAPKAAKPAEPKPAPKPVAAKPKPGLARRVARKLKRVLSK
ncbi:hypothetical protein, partial [Streptomyces prunicolor]|uniref:hypothetical protein n=1 Tax=Streptomyces prunicolor TaxID=67348 RepID=UPI003486AB32